MTAQLLAEEERELLDNPIWGALCTEHASLALGDGGARRYPAHIGPLSGIADQSASSFESLRRLAGSQGVVVLFSVHAMQPTPLWEVLRHGHLYQMVCARRAVAEPKAEGEALVRVLTAADAPAMVALAELTEPGPFRLRTLELGTFYGAFLGERLVAMAGKRMHLPGMVEVSGVCTHPEARGRGYAQLLMGRVMDEIEAAGRTPFLHVMTENPAVRLYESLGFAIREKFHFATLRSRE